MLEAMSRPIAVVAKMLEAMSRPIEVLAKMLKAMARTLEVLAKMLEAMTRPIEVVAKMLEAMSRPIEVLAKMLEAMSRPIEVEGVDCCCCRSSSLIVLLWVVRLPSGVRSMRSRETLRPNAKTKIRMPHASVECIQTMFKKKAIRRRKVTKSKSLLFVTADGLSFIRSSIKFDMLGWSRLKTPTGEPCNSPDS